MNAIAFRRRAGVLLGLLLSALPQVSAQADGAIATQTLRYAAAYQGIDAGEVVIEIRADDEAYVVTSTSKPSMLARMFVRDHVSATHFARRRDGLGERVVLAHGVERLVGEESYARRFRLDRARGRVEFSDNDNASDNDNVSDNDNDGDGDNNDNADNATRHGAIAADDRFEAAAFPLLLMLRPLDGLADTRVREVSARRIRDYVYEAPTPERIEVPAGRFASWRIRRHRADRPTDRVTVWLRKADGDDDAVPLKIQIDKRGKRSVLALAEQQVATATEAMAQAEEATQ
ncbi:MAG: DUF3108 domain-containing protein [bacterium]